MAVAIGIGAAELTYFVANLTKVTHGGWLPLLIALNVFTIMMTWHRRRELVTIRRAATESIPRPRPITTDP